MSVGEGREQTSAATTEELRLENLEPLFVALGDPYVPIRCSAMRALARLPLSQDASARFIAWVLERLAQLDQASTSDVPEIPPAEIIAAAGYVDAPDVRERLRRIVRDGTEDQRREAGHALATAGDEDAIGQLVKDLSGTDPALRLRAAQDLLQLGARAYLDRIRQVAAADLDSQVRATLSLVMAREGEPGPMVQLLNEFKARPDDSLQILFSVQNEVARRGPLPSPARAAIVSAIAELGDVEAPPLVFLVESIGVAEPTEPPARPTPAQWKPIGRHEGASLSKDLAEIVAGQDGERLKALDAGAVGELVNALLEDVMADPSSIGANDVVNLVCVRPDYAPDIPRIFRAYLLVTAPDYVVPPVVPMQLAWALSRAGLRRVVEGLAEPLGSPDPGERLAAADLIELTALYAHYSEPPIMSGGFGAVALPAVQDLTQQLIAENRARQESEETLRRPFGPRPEFEWAGERVVGDKLKVGEAVPSPPTPAPAPVPPPPAAAPAAAPGVAPGPAIPPPPAPAYAPAPPWFGPLPQAAPAPASRRSPLNPLIRSIGAVVGYLVDRVGPKFAGAGAGAGAYA
ncbi:MAG: hypothetical protein WAT58_12250, partial [Candidatus Dormiibacterota bacterium]